MPASSAQEEEDKAKVQKELSLLTDRLQKAGSWGPNMFFRECCESLKFQKLSRGRSMKALFARPRPAMSMTRRSRKPRLEHVSTEGGRREVAKCLMNLPEDESAAAVDM